MGLEPTTATLATWRSTTELHPHPFEWFTHIVGEMATVATPSDYKSGEKGFKGKKCQASHNPEDGRSPQRKQGSFFPLLLRAPGESLACAAGS